MKRTWPFLVLLILLSSPCLAKQVVSPTLPGTNIRDYSKSSTVIDGRNVYPTLPGCDARDYSKPGLRIENDAVYPTLPGTGVRDYSKPGWKLEGNTQQAFPELILPIQEDQ